MENNICNSMILTSRRRHFYLVGQSKHKLGACGVNNQASAVLAGNELPFVAFKETKFHYLVSQFEPKYVENIRHIVNSKSDTKYTDSKNRLLSLFKESENLRIKRLLTGIELGDMKPSKLLQKLKTVATSDISENLIKTLWLEKLSEPIKNILVVSDENLGKLAVMTDKISYMTPRKESFATGRSSDSGEGTSSKDQLLLDRIQSLEEQICQLSILHKSRTQ
ncbi:uncharacterized protein TNCV_3929681 [Trichonephila clavipes]|nr:uncharacterized protein TNCV_3929681 [Trichonephila clavipes]